MLLLHQVHKVNPSQHLLGQGQQFDGVSCGCGVEDDEVVLAGFQDVCHLYYGHKLIQARQGEGEKIRYVLLVKVGAPIGQSLYHLPVFLLKRFKSPCRIYLQSPEIISSGYGSDLIPYRTVEAVS